MSTSPSNKNHPGGRVSGLTLVDAAEERRLSHPVTVGQLEHQLGIFRNVLAAQAAAIMQLDKTVSYFAEKFGVTPEEIHIWAQEKAKQQKSSAS